MFAEAHLTSYIMKIVFEHQFYNAIEIFVLLRVPKNSRHDIIKSKSLK